MPAKSSSSSNNSIVRRRTNATQYDLYVYRLLIFKSLTYTCYLATDFGMHTVWYSKKAHFAMSAIRYPLTLLPQYRLSCLSDWSKAHHQRVTTCSGALHDYIAVWRLFLQTTGRHIRVHFCFFLLRIICTNYLAGYSVSRGTVNSVSKPAGEYEESYSSWWQFVNGEITVRMWMQTAVPQLKLGRRITPFI